MRYQYSNAEKTRTDENGKQEVIAVCDICGAEHKNSYGYEISYAMYGESKSQRAKYCGKCARAIIPALIKALEAAENKQRTNRERGLTP